MKATVISHAGIANRIKNILSAMTTNDEVYTIHVTTSYIIPSIKYLHLSENPYPEDWRLVVRPDEEKYIEKFKTIDLLYDKTPEYFIKKYLNLINKLKINPDIISYVDDYVSGWDNMVGVHIRSWYCQRRKYHDTNRSKVFLLF